MNRNQDFSDRTLWLWEKGPWIFLVLATLVLGGAALMAWRFEDHLGEIEAQLNYQPPRDYTPPDLSAFAADKSSEDLPVQQTLYAPVYSHVFYQGGRPFLLETTLSIRNTDLHKSVYLQSVRYYNAEGEAVKTFVDQLIRLKPLQSIDFLVEQNDTSGGSSASFLIQYRSEPGVSPPLVEAAMVGIVGAHGVSFSRQGQALPNTPP